MKKGVKFIILLVACIAVFFILVNIISSFFAFSLGISSSNSEQVQQGGDIRIGVSDSVSVSVTRNRWYGTIYEEGSAGTQTHILYLFGILRLPLVVDGVSMFLVNLIILVAVIFSAYIAIKRINKRHFERGYF